MAIAQTHRGGWFGRIMRAVTGKPDTTPVMSVLDVGEIEALLVEFDRVQEETAPLLKQLKDLKARIDEVPEGRYGTMRLKRGRTHKRFDQAAARVRLIMLGQPIPLMDVRGRTTVERVA